MNNPNPASWIPRAIIEQTIELTCTIQAIPAPTFQEEKRAAFLLDQLQSMGLQEVQVDETGNVFGRLPANQTGKTVRPVVISAHIDTVHPWSTPLAIHRTPDRIVGPAIGDNSLGVAALLSLGRLLQEPNVQRPGDLWLVFNTCEEGLGDLRGIKAVVDRFKNQPLAYLVVEGMGLGTILHHGLGVERYKISVHTSGGHSWVDYGNPSAIHELCTVIARLATIPLPHDPCTTLNVGMIQGGTSVNTIAANAWCEIDLRSENAGTLSQLLRDVDTLAHSVQRHGVQVKMERIGKRPTGFIPERHTLVLLAQEILMGLGLEARLDIASTDSNYPLSLGYPSICVGITNGNNAHTQEEFILTEPIGLGLAQLYQLVLRCWERL